MAGRPKKFKNDVSKGVSTKVPSKKHSYYKKLFQDIVNENEDTNEQQSTVPK